MNNLEYLKSKASEARSILGSDDADDSVNARSLKYMLEQLQAQIDEEEAKPPPNPAHLDIYFNGPAVFGAEGIDPALAGSALTGLVGIIDDQAPEEGQGGGGTGGKLYVDRTLSGSFGFGLREMSPQQSLFPTRLSEQVKAAVSLMSAVADTSEDFLTALADANPKGIDSMKRFFTSLKEHKATCKLSSASAVRIIDEAAVNRACARLQSAEQRHESVEVQCHFYGLTMLSGRFDIVTTEGRISGKISRAISQDDREKLNLDWTGKGCIAYLTKITTVSSGSQRVRHVLDRISPPRGPIHR